MKGQRSIILLLVLMIILLSLDIIIRIGGKVGTKGSGDKNIKEGMLNKADPKDKFDKEKFIRVYRAAKTLTATTEGGINYAKLQELNQNFLTEISIAADSIDTEREREIIALYKSAYDAYKTSETVWMTIIKYNLDNYAEQSPGQANRIIVRLKPIIDNYGLTLIPRESQYSGLMHELHAAELVKIWSTGSKYIDKANRVVLEDDSF